MTMVPSQLNLVLDTCAVLCSRERETLNQITTRKFDSLPDSTNVIIPYTVMAELRGVMKKKKEATVVKTYATNAHTYLSQFINSAQPYSQVRIQTKEEMDDVERAYYPPGAGRQMVLLNDSLILAYCCELQFTTNTETWLITEDRELLARCARSGLVGLTMASLRLAMTLEPYRRGHYSSTDYHCRKRNGQDSVPVSGGEVDRVMHSQHRVYDTHVRKREHQRTSEKSTVVPSRYKTTHSSQFESDRSRTASATSDRTQQKSATSIPKYICMVIVNVTVMMIPMFTIMGISSVFGEYGSWVFFLLVFAYYVIGKAPYTRLDDTTRRL